MSKRLLRRGVRGRRAFFGHAAALLSGALLARRAAAAPDAYPQTLAAVARAHQRVTDAHRRYLAFSKRAAQDGYRGIAYMFAAFAASEGVHARNFKALIVQLGGRAEVGPTTIAPATTKQNLIAAVDDEIDSIESLYPTLLERLLPEGNADAIRSVQFAWESERQHRDIMQKIRRYSPILFERVAKEIDDKTGLYFVCQTCGFTLNKVPNTACRICGSAPEQYRQVQVPA